MIKVKHINLHILKWEKRRLKFVETEKPKEKEATQALIQLLSAIYIDGLIVTPIQ